MHWRAWLGFETRVAVRFLREGRLQTVLIMVGVAAGVAVIAYISALVTGLQQNTFDKTLGGQAHVTVQALDDVVTPARAVDAGHAGAQRRPVQGAASALGGRTGSRCCRCSSDAAGCGGGVAHRRRWRPGGARRGDTVDRAVGRRPRSL